jgi:hypothetical protein
MTKRFATRTPLASGLAWAQKSGERLGRSLLQAGAIKQNVARDRVTFDTFTSMSAKPAPAGFSRDIVNFMNFTFAPPAAMDGRARPA